MKQKYVNEKKSCIWETLNLSTDAFNASWYLHPSGTQGYFALLGVKPLSQSLKFTRCFALFLLHSFFIVWGPLCPKDVSSLRKNKLKFIKGKKLYVYIYGKMHRLNR